MMVPLSAPPSEIADFPNSTGSFDGTDLSHGGEAMVQQAHNLSVLLRLDTLSLMGERGAASPQAIEALKTSASSNLANAMDRAELLISMMAALVKVAEMSFELLVGTKPTCQLTTAIDSSCLQSLALAGVDFDSCVNAEHLYQAISVRANELESMALEVVLEGVQSKMRLNRLELASITGNFLSKQAQNILDTEFLDTDEFQIDEHPTTLQLQAVAKNPFVKFWPRSELSQE